MEKIIKQAKELSLKIANSSVYREYKRTGEIIKADPEKLAAVNEIKKLHLEYHNRAENGVLSFDEERYLSQQSYKIALNEDIKIYLECEQKLIKTLNSVFNVVAEHCPLDIYID